MHPESGKGAGHTPPLHPQTPAPKWLSHTCSQKVTVAQSGHR